MYAIERDNLCTQIRIAMREGRVNHARHLERRIRRLQGAQVDDLSQTRFFGLDPDVGCRWPGAYDQWVDENLGKPVNWDLLLTG